MVVAGVDEGVRCPIRAILGGPKGNLRVERRGVVARGNAVGSAFCRYVPTQPQRVGRVGVGRTPASVHVAGDGRWCHFAGKHRRPLAGPHPVGPVGLHRQWHARQLTLQLVDNVQRNGPVVAGAGALEAQDWGAVEHHPEARPAVAVTVAVDQHQFTPLCHAHRRTGHRQVVAVHLATQTWDVVSTPHVGVASPQHSGPIAAAATRRDQLPVHLISPRVCGDVQRHRHRIAFTLGEGMVAEQGCGEPKKGAFHDVEVTGIS